MPFTDLLTECAISARSSRTAGAAARAWILERARLEILALRDEVTRLRAENDDLRRNLDYWYTQAVGA